MHLYESSQKIHHIKVFSTSNKPLTNINMSCYLVSHFPAQKPRGCRGTKPLFSTSKLTTGISIFFVGDLTP